MQSAKQLRFLLVDVSPTSIKTKEAEENLAELVSLVDTFGGATIVRIIQRRASYDNHTYIGAGKAEEVGEMVKNEKIDVIVLNGIVKPGVLFHLTEMYWPMNPNIQVWDRVDLIIGIFDKHAKTAEAKLQIRLAKMRHMGPRIYGLGGTSGELSRQGGGIGSKGSGETNTENMKRHLRNEIKTVEEELARLAGHRERQLERRRELGFKTMSIVGYTNAGKSTLFNLLTGKKKKAEDALFATLDSNVGKVYLQQAKKELLISDTIGFIQNLPAKLIQAFKSTLMESINADILMHVVDATDPKMEEKIMVVNQILRELGINEKPTIYVFNKIDILTKEQMLELLEKNKFFKPQLVSAQENYGTPELMEEIERVVAGL